MSSLKHIATSPSRLGWIERDRVVSAILCAAFVDGVANANPQVMGRDRKLPEGPRI